MLIAILSDIHSNREAFEACLADAAQRGAQRYVLLGDIVGYGADPVFAVERAMDLVDKGAVAVMGNHDEAILLRAPHMNGAAKAAIEWTRERLSPSHREFLSRLPILWEDATRLYVHASAANPPAWNYVMSRRDAEASLRATSCPVTLCGHVHVPALYNVSPVGKLLEFTPVPGVAIGLVPQRRWVAVLGAVGQPRDGNPAACYGLLDDQTNMLTYLRVPYDIESAARKIRAAGLPESLAGRLDRGR